MIRRDSGDEWLLIGQVEHARLAAELAEMWDDTQVCPLPNREFLIPTILHHDDGWSEWEAAPEIDPDTGIPRQFTEMEPVVVVEIWRRSILLCARGNSSVPNAKVRNLLPAVWTSLHCHLAERIDRARSGNQQVVARFLEAQQQLRRRWLNRTDDVTEQVVASGFRFLQLFDLLSLWLCCAERTERFEAQIPETPRLSLVPRRDRITVEPWPFAQEEVTLAVTARAIPARPATGARKLQERLIVAPHVSRTWHLRRC